VAIAGLSIAFPAEGDGRVVAALRDALGRLPASPSAPDIRVRLRPDDELPPAPGETWAAWPGLAVHRTSHGSSVVGEEVIAVVEGGDVVITGDGAEAHRVVPLALAQALRPLGRYLVHGALLVADAAVVLVLGPTGTGKSTMAYAAAQAGWTVRSDDLTVLRDGPDGAILASGVPRRARVPEELGLTATAAGPADGRGRREVDLSEPGDEVAITALATLSWGAAPRGAVHGVGPAAVLHELLGSWFGSSDPDDVRAWFPLAARLARLPAFGVALSAEPTSRTGDAAEALRAGLARPQESHQ
jgi:hypothetical protein